MAKEFRYRRRVQWVDTDKGGIIHFSNYFRYMEETETEFHLSLGTETLHRGNVPFRPRRAVEAEFLRTVTFGDLLDIYLRVEKVGRSSITYSFRFEHEGEQVARAGLTVVFVKPGEDGRLKPIDVPPNIRAALTDGPE